MKKYLIATLLLTFIISMPALSQEATDLIWFPDGVYYGLLHINANALDKNLDSGWHDKLLKTVFDDLNMADTPFGTDGFSSITFGLAERVEWVTERKRGKGDEKGMFDLWDIMIAYQFADPGGIIDKKLESGELIPLSRKMLGRSVYIYTREGSEGKHHVYLTGDGTLLVSESALGIQAMVASGVGRTTSILDNPDFAEIEKIMPKNTLWYISMDAHSGRAAIERKIEEGKSEKELKSTMESIEQAPEYIVLSVEFSDRLMFAERKYFRNSSDAEAAFASNVVDIDDAFFVKEALLSNNSRLEGSQIITKLEFDPELIIKMEEEKKKEN